MLSTTQNVSPLRVEYSTKIIQCQGPKPCNRTDIAKGDLRIGNLIGKGKARFSWRHWGCVTPQFLEKFKAADVKTSSQVDGYDDLFPEDKLRLDEAWDRGRIAEDDVREVHKKPVGEKFNGPGGTSKSPRKKKSKAMVMDTSSEEEDGTSGDDDRPLGELISSDAGKGEDEEPPPKRSRIDLNTSKQKTSPSSISHITVQSTDDKTSGTKGSPSTGHNAERRQTGNPVSGEMSRKRSLLLGGALGKVPERVEQAVSAKRVEKRTVRPSTSPPQYQVPTWHLFQDSEEESTKPAPTPPKRVPYTLKELFSPPRRRTAKGKERARTSSESSGSSEETDDSVSDEDSSNIGGDDGGSTGASEEENEVGIAEERGEDHEEDHEEENDESNTESSEESDEDSEEERSKKRPRSINRYPVGRRGAAPHPPRPPMYKLSYPPKGYVAGRIEADSDSEPSDGCQESQESQEEGDDGDGDDDGREEQEGDEERPQVLDSVSAPIRGGRQRHATDEEMDIDAEHTAAEGHRASVNDSRTGEIHVDVEDRPPPWENLENTSGVPDYDPDALTAQIKGIFGPPDDGGRNSTESLEETRVGREPACQKETDQKKPQEAPEQPKVVAPKHSVALQALQTQYDGAASDEKIDVVKSAAVAADQDAEPASGSRTNGKYVDNWLPPPQTTSAITEAPTFHLDAITAAIIQRVAEVQGQLDILEASSTTLLSRLGLGDYAPGPAAHGMDHADNRVNSDGSREETGQKRKANRTFAYPRKTNPSSSRVWFA